MKRIIAFIDRDVQRALTIALVAVIVTAALVGRYNKCLTTPGAPNAIISLELATTHQQGMDAVNSWSSVMYEVHWSIYFDFAFIFAYTFGLFVLLAMAAQAIANTTIPIWKTPGWVTNVAMVLPWVAFACDFIENFFMLMFIPDGGISVFLFSVPAYIKFVSIALVLVYCIAAPMAHRHVLKASRLYAPGLVTVLLSYFVFIRLDQGQDIMIQVIEWSGPTLWSPICAFLWVWYIWYSSRLVGYAKMQQPGGLVPPSYHKHFPRLLAFNGLVSLQAASLALPTLGGLSAAELWLFVILQNGVYFLWDDFAVNKRRDSGLLVALFSGGYLWLLMDIASKVKPDVQNQVALLVIDGIIYVIALLVVRMWIVRRKNRNDDELILDPCKPPVVYEAYLRIFWIKVLSLQQKAFEKEKPWFRIFNVLAGAGLILYVCGFGSVDFAGRMGPLAFVLLAFGILVGISNIITIFSIYKKTNFFFVFFILAFVVGFFYDPFKVRLVEPKPKPRTDMIGYFDKWIEYRKSKIDSAKTDYPVYVVIADGGASRSGYWVSSVLSRLQDESIDLKENDTTRTLFSDNLLCLAGASGGSVGNATFYAMLKSRMVDGIHNDSSYLSQSRSFLKNDFLTPVITHWLGSDFFQHFFPFGAEDRAGILENAMEEFSEKSNIPFDVPFDSIIDRSGKMPMLFINVTSLHDGLPAVVSSVPVKPFSQRVDIIKQLEGLNEGTIRYSTAVVLGARFPYVSPAGRIGNDYYVDGGYFDNTGAGIVHEMMQEVDSVMKSRIDSRADTSLLRRYQKLRFRLLYLSNSPFEAVADTSRCSGYKAPTKEIHPLSNDLAAPILTVLGTYGSQTDVNNKRLQSFMLRVNPHDDMYTVNLYTKNDKNVYPMNWVISDYNLLRMNHRLDSAKRELDLILNVRH